MKDEVLRGVKEGRSIVRTIKRRIANWIGHFLRRNRPLKCVTQGKVEETRRRGRRCKQLPDDVQEKRIYWKFKKESLDHTVR